MDNLSLIQVIDKIPELKYKYLGSFPADKVPRLITNTFAIVNTKPSSMTGEHWIMLADRDGKKLYGDSLGLQLGQYKHVRVAKAEFQRMVYSRLQEKPLCGLYCIFFAWTVFKGLEIPNFFNDFDLMQFIYKYL